MRSLNQITLVGRMGDEPELRTSKSGNPWMRISVATDRRVRDGDTWKDATDWHRVHLFGKQAESCARMGHKGLLVGIEGSLMYDRWTDDDGQERRSPQVMGRSLTVLGPRRPERDAS